MVNSNSCNSCGGRVHFDPKTQKIICEYCHNTQEIKPNKKINTFIKDTLKPILAPHVVLN